MKEKNRESYLSRRAVIVDPEDRQRRAAVQILSTIKSSKLEKRRISDRTRAERKSMARVREAAKFQSARKEERKRRYSEEGKSEAKRAVKKQRN
jgi:ribosome biogenesis protein BMS1